MCVIISSNSDRMTQHGCSVGSGIGVPVLMQVGNTEADQ